MKTIILIMLTLLPLQAVASTQLKDFGKSKQITNSVPKFTVTYESLEVSNLLVELNKSECNPKVYKNPLKVVNRKGAAGKWQMTAIARKDAGFKGTLKQFLNSEIIQRQCVLQSFENNKKYIKHLIPEYKKYIGKTVHGVKITYSGMIIAAHLSGVGGLRRFLRTGHNATDGNETVKSYMRKFQGYHLKYLV